VLRSYRDKRVVGVFVRFFVRRFQLQLSTIPEDAMHNTNAMKEASLALGASANDL
jgi:hypothetical protein